MEEIAAILGADGSSTTLTEPGNLVVFRREKGAWTNNRTMPLALDQTQGLHEMRNKMAGTPGIPRGLPDRCHKISKRGPVL